MKVLVVGYGSMGRRHADWSKALGHEVVVIDASADRCAAAALGGHVVSAPAHGWHDADAVVIATPASTHSDLICRAATDTDAAILVEKPLALSADDFFGPWGDVVRFDRPVFVGYNMRYNAVIDCVRERWIAELDGAPPQAAFFRVLCDGSSWPGRDYADALLECSHEIDLALWLFGKVSAVESVRSSADARAWDLTLVHRIGTRTRIVLSTRESRYDRGAEFAWANGVTMRYAIDDPVLESRSKTLIEASYKLELEEFLAVASGGTSTRLATSTDGLNVLHVCDAARATRTVVA